MDPLLRLFYELSDAILDKNMDEIKKELGDILLHIVFYSRIASETNDFDISDVINSVCDKLIHRHPHIYGDIQVEDEVEVKKNWEKLKNLLYLSKEINLRCDDGIAIVVVHFLQ